MKLIEVHRFFQMASLGMKHETSAFIPINVILPFHIIEALSSTEKLTEKISAMFITGDNPFDKKLNFPKKMHQQSLFDIIETYALVNRDALIKRFQLDREVVELEKQVTVETIQSCSSSGSLSTDTVAEISYLDLVETLSFFTNDL